MKFTLNWLKKFLETDASVDLITKQLTSLGLEVEQVIDKSKELAPFIVAEIIEVSPHPHAEKLRVCKVFDGINQLQIVCGAPNARSGIKVVLAPIGAVIPANSMVIKQSKIRDIDSQGMLCSAAELKLSKESDGIIELDINSSVGEKFIKVSGLDDPIIELSITPNRGDCLGVYGIARELAASGFGKLKATLQQPVKENINELPMTIKLEPGIGCKRFVARYFKGISNNSISPEPVRQKLQAVGSKSISPIVDITNIICFSFARPLHAYDADLIVGDVTIRKAKEGEKFLALNEAEYEMKGGEIVICDEQGIISLGGIIGGKRAACSANTKNILLEIAVFDATDIAKAGRLHMIETDSRYRMERKIDEGFLQNADLIASNMILELCGGIASAKIDLVNAEYEDRYINYSTDYFLKKAGFNIPSNKMSEILVALGFAITELDNAFKLKVPSYRNDISMEDDITEEILRIYGYDNIPQHSLLTDGDIVKPVITKKTSNSQLIARRLALLGYNELVTWSFMEKNQAANFADFDEQLKLENPISSELSYMRPTIIPNLLNALKTNSDRGFDDLSFFETGPVFSSSYQGFQQNVCAAVRSGFALKKSVHHQATKYNIFDIKRDLFALIKDCGFDPNKMNLVQDNNIPKYYHPAQSASISMGKNMIAFFGKLNPVILAHYGLDLNSFAFELFTDNLPLTKSKAGKRPPTEFSDYPALRRDFAFILDKNYPAGALPRMIEAIDRKLIKRVEIFDSFEGASLSENKKSLAIAVMIQASDRTLTDAEIEGLSQNIIKEVQDKAGGFIRG